MLSPPPSSPPVTPSPGSTPKLRNINATQNSLPPLPSPVGMPPPASQTRQSGGKRVNEILGARSNIRRLFSGRCFVVGFREWVLVELVRVDGASPVLGPLKGIDCDIVLLLLDREAVLAAGARADSDIAKLAPRSFHRRSRLLLDPSAWLQHPPTHPPARPSAPSEHTAVTRESRPPQCQKDGKRSVVDSVSGVFSIKLFLTHRVVVAGLTYPG
ncbi:hypothetical protein BKA70DRAFT_1488966 [Coprinopsis sp. MPI-PUGE-AT-0042]|nr:hypothetical protein BKA70DRAFT_1488966 [Coprinopsis sp. MPI-PUGE-AT-0042]